MSNIKDLALILIASGGALMFLSIIKYRTTIEKAGRLLSEDSGRACSLYRAHRLLMFFFLAGYIAVIISIIFEIDIIGTFFTGMIFFFGAVFVFIGILVQSDMLRSIRVRHEEIVNKNARLVQTENVTIFALAYLAEIRDQETGKHLERTAGYVQIIAEELALLPKYSSYITPYYITDIVKSAPLHDIGKVGVPDSILKKPGKLEPEEFELMKRHCEYGADILKMSEKRLDFESFFRVAIRLVLSYHEKWDGSGYPSGLSGTDIPLSARIMALADVYDALRSERCYKKSFSHRKTIEIIESERGSHFDPDVTDAFLKAEKRFLEISESMKD